MADNGSSQATSAWPLPTFCFEVKWDSAVMAFQEVSGLDVEAQIIEYRAGQPGQESSPLFSTPKMPGLNKSGNVTLKNGVYKSDNKFRDWFSQIKMNTIKRQPVTISLLDEAGNATMVWTLTNAWPSKITGTDLKSDDMEVVIEALEVVHEGISIDNR
ncbi:phage tail protein [Arsukibacterium indicum]|uniref:Phage tail protein n=1 Tax=Arsukibacterium indicum TaxID=2848612 RepID=A0ABS6MHM8_9GAMM|nr:phage tail protein [Arsukibacterium indicum]MBV2128304.1 phage tail protein [Arsukibacterium indicum]